MQGPSPEQDQRELRVRDEQRGLWQYADDLSSGGAEVLFLGLPGFVILVNSGYLPGSVAFVALISLVVVTVGVTARSRWLAGDPPWPGWSVSTFVFRVGYYSLTMTALGFVGATIDATVGTLPATGFVVVVGSAAALSLPRLYGVTRRGVRRLRRWHAWLFGS